MQPIIAVIGVLVGAYLLSKLADFVKIPRVAAYISLGLLLGMEPLNSLIIGDSFSTVSRLGDIALLSLLFFAGLKISAKKLLHETKEAFEVSFFSALTPFATGFLVFYWLGYHPIVGLVVGVAMSISAEGTTAAVLMETGKIKTRIGTLILEAGIIDDIMGLIAFVTISFFLREVHIGEDILVTAAIIAFFVGVFIRARHNKKDTHEKAEQSFMNLLIPFFFVSMGHSFDFHSILPNIKLLLIIVSIAFLGKFLGAFMAKPFTSLSWLQLRIVGWAMNSRGAIELALALIAFRTGVIPAEIYSSLVLMALITTLAFPFAFTYLIKRHPKAMN